MYLGLTGNIASGKSTVAELFEKYGCFTIDLDEISKIVMSPKGVAFLPIVDTFGGKILNTQSEIDRAILKDLVFNDKEKLQKLEQIVHPAIQEYERKWVGRIKGKNSKAIIITHAALIIEKESYHRFDAVMVVYVSPEVQMKRLLKRDNMTLDLAKKIVAIQMSIDKKLKYANFVINNNGSIKELELEVERVMDQLKIYQYTHKQLKKNKSLKDISKFKCF